MISVNLHYQIRICDAINFNIDSYTAEANVSVIILMAPPTGQTISQTTGTSTADAETYADFNWDELGFGIVPTDYMYVMKSSEGESFTKGNVTPFGNIEMNPYAGILNYGQGLIEGLKAYRKEDGRVLLFRPEQNAQRLKIGAERMCMSSPSVEQFVEAVKQTVRANKHWVPPQGKGSLYVRPLLIGSGPVLGLCPAPEYTFLIYASPVGNYHKGPLNLVVEDKLHRATPGGTGDIKTVANYSPVCKALTEARAKGFSDVLFLDAVTKKYIEEVSTCNIFIVKDDVISTPATVGTILPGITRKSIIEIALDFGYQVEERTIPMEDLLEADEVFCTGTAVVVSPVGCITYQDKRVEYKTGAETVSQKLYVMLTGIQTGRVEDKLGWTVEVV
ncbi:branched-chain-amino-acid aminotransferase 6-like isoform X3 [Juglans microcarpa x Juglans regia]|uniref:branched-chain-amino-acid aminotransferase 6-like isoform X3 n=1 Tax=Juglans microcarpa x Juglans regia TaxID=2249226 RepID=UPI001B7DE553|nr:branched-chain-amino-acid aminotransferase 6-like isoform X3 [Juglans microcarpa x Juglans regia]